jgi:hypothetical protein
MLLIYIYTGHLSLINYLRETICIKPQLWWTLSIVQIYTVFYAHDIIETGPTPILKGVVVFIRETLTSKINNRLSTKDKNKTNSEIL